MPAQPRLYLLQLPVDMHLLCLHSAFQAEPGDTGDAERKEGCDVSPGRTGSPLHPPTAFELSWTHSPILPGRKTQVQTVLSVPQALRGSWGGARILDPDSLRPQPRCYPQPMLPLSQALPAPGSTDSAVPLSSLSPACLLLWKGCDHPATPLLLPHPCALSRALLLPSQPKSSVLSFLSALSPSLLAKPH